MSRESVRAQVAAYLAPVGNPPRIEFCSTVISHPPKVTNSDRFDTGRWDGSGGIIFIFIPAQVERRIAFGGEHDGRKFRLYTFELLLVFQSVKPLAEDVGADFDRFLDSLVELIQADRNLGTASAVSGSEVVPGMIFQAGEGDEYGGKDIRISTLLPRTARAGVTEIIGSLTLDVAEILNT